MRWVGAARALAEVAAFAASVVLARLIPPADFGYFAIVTLVFLLANALAGDGVTSALVRLPAVTRAHLESAAFFAIVTGAGASLLVLALAPLVSPVLGSEVAALAQLASPITLIMGLGAVSRAELQRRLAFRQLGTIDAVTGLAGLATSIALAAGGLDAEALVAGPLAAQTLSTVLAWRAAPSPWPHRHPELRDIRVFAVPHAGAGIAAALAQNVDYLVLAARTGPAIVGFYWRGFQLGVVAQSKLSGVLTGLALPLYARSANRDEQLLLRSRIVRLQTILIAPLLACLVLLAPILVPGIFGERWEPAVVPTQVLAGAGFLATAATGTGPLIAALDRPGAMLSWNLWNTVFLAIAVFIAAPEGLVVLSFTVLGVRILRFFASYQFLLKRIAGIRFRTLLNDLSPALVTGSIALAAGGLAQALALAELPELVETLAVGAVVVGAYAAVLRFVFPSGFGEVASALGRLARRGSG